MMGKLPGLQLIMSEHAEWQNEDVDQEGHTVGGQSMPGWRDGEQEGGCWVLHDSGVASMFGSEPQGHESCCLMGLSN